MNVDAMAETLLPSMMVGCATTTTQQQQHTMSMAMLPSSTSAATDIVPNSENHMRHNVAVATAVISTQHDGIVHSALTANQSSVDKKPLPPKPLCKMQSCDNPVCPDTMLTTSSKSASANSSKPINSPAAAALPPHHSITTNMQTHRSIITPSQFKCAQEEKPKPLVASPKQAMVLYMNKLTPYEHHEIFKYPQIYFIGANAKKRPGIIGPNNSDYDNEQGSYIHIPHDHVAYRYEVLKIIGKGSFGQVVKAYDHKNHEHVALKMVRNEKRFHRQAQEEIRILSHLRKQDESNSMNVIHMFDYFTFRNHMCITFELLYINLYELIKKNKFQGFSLQLVRKFAHSLLQCLDALAKNKIIHCDMKPENVLLKQQGRSGIKVRPHTKRKFRLFCFFCILKMS